MPEGAGATLFSATTIGPETVLQRLQVYEEKTAPLINHYHRGGNLRQISGVGAENEVFARILIAMDPDLS